MKTGPSGYSRGFTFLELLITMVLLVLGVIPVVATLAVGVSADHFAEGRSLALALAQEEIEVLKAGSFDGVITSVAGAVTDFTNYQRQVTVSGEGNLKHVTVIVDWTFKGQAQQISLDTLIADPAPGA